MVFETAAVDQEVAGAAGGKNVAARREESGSRTSASISHQQQAQHRERTRATVSNSKPLPLHPFSSSRTPTSSSSAEGEEEEEGGFRQQGFVVHLKPAGGEVVPITAGAVSGAATRVGADLSSSLKLYAREEEERQLLDALDRCCTRRTSSSDDAGELVLVTGRSGSGKSYFVESVFQSRFANLDGAGGDGFFVSGKFDQLERPEQYYPIVRAFTEYARLVSGSPPALAAVQDSLRRDFNDASHQSLIDLIPPLGLLFGKDVRPDDDTICDAGVDSEVGRNNKAKNNVSNSTNDKRRPSAATVSSSFSNTVEQQHRCSMLEQIHNQTTYAAITAAFSRFLSCVCSPSRPLVIFLDDLQWAEPSSLELFATLVGEKIPGLLLVGACRGNEVSLQHELSVALREMEDQNVNILQIEMRDFDYQALSEMVADVLSQPVHKIQKLVDLLWDHTQGNIFFVVQLLQDLSEEGLLRHSEEDSATWSLDSGIKVAARINLYRGDDQDALRLISGKIQRLDQSVQHVLMGASCLGAEFDEYLLQLAVGFDIVPALSCAEKRKLLLRQPRRTWRFAHDQIQQSAYSLIPNDEREAIHLQIGRALWMSLSPDMLKKSIFLVVNQLRHGLRLIAEEEERHQTALLLLRAGEISTEASAFVSAAEYLNLGIQLLSKRGKREWRDEYDLALSLYSAAAEVEYCNGNFVEMDRLVAEILEHARCLEDKSRALMLSVYSLGSRNDLQKAIDRGFEVLREFGEHFSSKPSVFSIIVELRKTKKMLRRLSDDGILSLPKMRDPEKLSAMRIMNLLFTYTLTGRPMYAPLVAMRLVQTTVIFGMSRMASVAFSSFAVMLVCPAFDDVALGIRYAKVALRVLDKTQAKEWLPRTYSAVYGFCLTAVEPMRDQLQPLLVSHRVGLSGDIEFSMLSAALYTGLALNSSAPLPQLLEDSTAFLGLMKFHKQTNMIHTIRPNMQFVMNMMGQCDDPLGLSGEAMDFDEALKEAIESQNAMITSLILLNKLMLLSYFQQYEAAEEVSIEMLKHNRESFGRFTRAAYWLSEGLVSIALSDKHRCRRIGVGRRNLRRLKKLASFSKCNNLNKVLLLEAEIAAVSGRFHQSLPKYDQSIEFAMKEKLWSEAGLAAECAARRLERRGRRGEARAYLETAVAAYEAWGAHAKVVDVRRKLEALSPLTHLNGSSSWVYVPVRV